MKTASFVSACIGLSVLDALLMGAGALMMYFYGASWLSIVCCVSVTVALMIMMAFMDKRTKQGNEWLGQILGLKEFILTAEKDRLELLVKDDPSAFYHILPYAYVLGISDTWSDKFEDLIIEQPDWYESTMPYPSFSSIYWWHRFNRSFHAMSASASYIPQAKGGSGGGSIGGISGGGGFSGGGFGGGGGGSR